MADGYNIPTFQTPAGISGTTGGSDLLKNAGFGLLGGALFGSDVGQSVFAGLGVNDQLNNIGAMQRNVADYSGQMMNTLPNAVQFKPYTVTSGLGTTNVGADGGMSYNLSGQQQNIANQAFGNAQQFMTQAGQQNPMLSQQANLFGNMAQGYQPSGFQRQGVGNYGVNVAQGMPEFQARQITDTISPYGFGNAQVNALANQAMGMGMQQMAQAGQAPADIEGLRGTAAGQAQGMLSGLGQSMGDRESEVYNRIRAMQTPEEQRQQMALEERLAAQGRLGVSTAQYGGTPEQLAMAKAQEEAKNQAALTAMQQAGSEADRAYSQATGLAGLTGQLAGTSSDLQTASQARAQQLANMGMSAEQINSQLQSEGLSRSLQAGEYNRQGTLLSDQLQQTAFDRALASGQYGRQGQELASRLSSEALNRQIAAGGFMNQQDQLAQQMRSADIQNQLALAGGAQGALAQQLGLQQGYGQLGAGMLSAGYTPYQQMLAQMEPSLRAAQLGMAGAETGAGLAAQLGLGNLQYQTALEQQKSDTIRQLIQSMGGIGGAQAGTSGGSSGGFLTPVVKQVGSSIGDYLGGLFSGGSSGGAFEDLMSSGEGTYLGAGGQGYTQSQWDDILNTQPNVTVNTSGLGAGYGFGSPYDPFGG